MSELFEETLVILQVRPKLIESFSTLYYSLFGLFEPQSYFKEHKSTLLHYFFTPTIFHLQLPPQSIGNCIHHCLFFNCFDILNFEGKKFEYMSKFVIFDSKLSKSLNILICLV